MARRSEDLLDRAPARRSSPSRITATRSARRATTARSWLIRISAAPRAVCRVEQVEDLRLDGDVERGGRLVGDQQLRVERDRRGDQGALAQAARELVRQLPGAHLRLGHADLLQQLDHAPLAVARGRPGRARAAPRRSPRRPVRSGSSETRRPAARSRPRLPRMLRQWRSPSPHEVAPAVAGAGRAVTRAPSPVSPTRVRAVTLLPEPDSPTIARHSPARSEKEMPATTSRSSGPRPKPPAGRRRRAVSSATLTRAAPRRAAGGSGRAP